MESLLSFKETRTVSALAVCPRERCWCLRCAINAVSTIVMTILIFQACVDGDSASSIMVLVLLRYLYEILDAETVD